MVVERGEPESVGTGQRYEVGVRGRVRPGSDRRGLRQQRRLRVGRMYGRAAGAIGDVYILLSSRRMFV